MRPIDTRITQLKTIPGFGSHVLVGHDGEFVSHDALNSEALGALVSLCSEVCPHLGKDLMASSVHHLAFHRGSSERFYVMPVGGHCLGFFQTRGSVSHELLAKVDAWKESFEA